MPLILPFVALAVMLGSAASALTITVTSPPTGQWTASDTGVVNGTASGASPDRFVLDSAADFSGGSSTNTTQAAGYVNHTLPSSESWKYFQDFSGSLSAPALDGYWTWNQNATSWSVASPGGLTPSPPALVHNGTLAESVTFRVALPNQLLSGRLDFKYACQANATLDVWVSADGRPSSEAAVLSSAASPPTSLSFDLGPLSGAPALFVRFWGSASTAFAAACAVDDFQLLANYTRAESFTFNYDDDFAMGQNAVWAWGDPSSSWDLGNVSGTSDTLPSLVSTGEAWASARANWQFPGELTRAVLTFHRQCLMNASIGLFVSQNGTNESLLDYGDFGSPHTVVTVNLTANFTGKHGLFIRFYGSVRGPSENSCGVDDFGLNVSHVGHANLTYSGLFLSRFFDLGYDANVTASDWTGATPANTSIVASIRLSTNNISFSPFVDIPAAGGPVTPPLARYFQIRVAFASQGGLAAAAFDRLGLNFSALASVEWSLDGSTWYLAQGTSQWSATVPLAGGSNTVAVRVRDSTGASATSSVALLRDTFPPSAPGKPAGPTVTNGTQAIWTWVPSIDVGVGVAQYLVDVGLTLNGTELAASASTTDSNFTVSDLPEGVRVFVRVRAVDAGGLVSPYSPSSDPLLVDRTAPAPVAARGPGPFVASPVLRWTWGPGQDVGSGVAAYLVRIGTTPGANNTVEATTTNTSYTFANGVSATTYFATVFAIDAAGNYGPGVTSPPTTVDTDAPLPPATVSGPPAITNETTLTWTWPAGVDSVSGVDHYYITLGSTPGGTQIAGLSWSVQTYTLSFPTSGTTYYFTVSAVDRAGNTGLPVAAAVVLVDTAAPLAPPLAAIPNFVGNTTQTLRWTASFDAAPNGSGVDYYRVRVSDGLSTVITPVDALLLLLSLTDGRSYSVGVAAVDIAGNTGPEGTLSFSADLSGPSAPSGLRVTVLNPAVPTFSASWNVTVDVGSGVKEYRVSVGTTPGGADVVDSRLAGGRNFTWTGAFNTNYYVTVWAVDNLAHAGNRSQSSSAVSVTQGGGGFLPGVQAFAALGALAAASCVAVCTRRLLRPRG